METSRGSRALRRKFLGMSTLSHNKKYKKFYMEISDHIIIFHYGLVFFADKI